MRWELLLLGLPSLLLSGGLILLWRKRKNPSLPLRMGSALGWCALAVVPAVVVQIVMHTVDGGNSLDALGGSPIAWWVLLGGATVIHTFEGTVQLVSDHRQFTMLDNMLWFLTLLVLQTLILVASLAPCFGPDFRLKHPRLCVAFLFLAANALLGVTWPWWGS